MRTARGAGHKPNGYGGGWSDPLSCGLMRLRRSPERPASQEAGTGRTSTPPHGEPANSRRRGRPLTQRYRSDTISRQLREARVYERGSAVAGDVKNELDRSGGLPAQQPHRNVVVIHVDWLPSRDGGRHMLSPAPEYGQLR